MSKKHATHNGGMFLFDFPNYVGKWKGVTEYRGMIEAWRNKERNEEIQIVVNEDRLKEKLYDVWIQSIDGTWCDILTCDVYDEALKVAHEYMEKSK